mmetsp:Transcript_15967/g.20458  ORF Transcript_15967/g.20458 Transcript_15967/m.20458 type:complete len:222 (-) Transcript_15967:183-848(-)|eukprot:CAMPEP_0117859844 /NCGR_PEP_ID=MMETSP0950-20121206/3409_1 /TAXON_ID=44440 /ORGANISM="Chattonella subsalsa, Strain CCMP2191" /LENGTH=221 /DNA_ID=CAMNT_0005709863 /DNA_START=377 /DNA_END=1042 /DNA_ORIENTATION=+
MDTQRDITQHQHKKQKNNEARTKSRQKGMECYNYAMEELGNHNNIPKCLFVSNNRKTELKPKVDTQIFIDVLKEKLELERKMAQIPPALFKVSQTWMAVFNETAEAINKTQAPAVTREKVTATYDGPRRKHRVCARFIKEALDPHEIPDFIASLTCGNFRGQGRPIPRLEEVYESSKLRDALSTKLANEVTMVFNNMQRRQQNKREPPREENLKHGRGPRT